MDKRLAKIAIIGSFLSGLVVFLSASSTLSNSAGNPQGAHADIRVGIVVPLTGSVPSFGVEVRNGVLLAVKEWNDRGGINGSKIVTFVEDGQCAALPGVQAARKLIFTDNIHYLIGEVCSVASMPISEIANASQVIQVSPTSTNPRVTIDKVGNVKPYVFRNCFIDPYQGLVAAKFARNNLAAKTAFIMGDSSNEYVSGLMNTFDRYFPQLGGTVVGRGYYIGDQTDFSAILAQVQAAKPDIVYLPDYYNIVNLVTRQAKASGLAITFVGGDGWDSQDLDLEAAEGSYFDNHFSDQDARPEVSLFLDLYNSSFPDRERSVGVQLMIAALAYDAAYMIFQCIKEAGTDDTTQVAKRLESIHFHGVTGDLSFDGHHDPMKTAYMFKIKDHAVQFVTRIDP
jgi:branched-chain amino acid transport system substrate-binding protein